MPAEMHPLGKEGDGQQHLHHPLPLPLVLCSSLEQCCRQDPLPRLQGAALSEKVPPCFQMIPICTAALILYKLFEKGAAKSKLASAAAPAAELATLAAAAAAVAIPRCPVAAAAAAAAADTGSGDDGACA